MRRSVLHVSDSTAFGGAEQALLNLLAGTDREQWQLTLAHYDVPGSARLVEGARACGVETWAIEPMPPGVTGLRRLPSFSSTVHSRRFSVVHLHLTWPIGCQYEQLGAWIARTSRVVATVQLFVQLDLSTRVRVQQRLMSRTVDRHIAVSEDVKRQLVHDLGWRGDHIDVIHNSVDIDRVRAAAAAAPPANTGPENEDLVVVPARLTNQKGHDTLLRAVASLPDARVWLAGDGEERQRLEQLHTDLALADRVTFLGERRDVPELLAAATVVALPSLYEGLPLALLEAMALGKAIVTTDIGGTRELVTHEHDGLLVPPGDEGALAAALRRLLDDAPLRLRLGANAMKTAEHNFSNKAMCERVMGVYRSVLG